MDKGVLTPTLASQERRGRSLRWNRKVVWIPAWQWGTHHTAETISDSFMMHSFPSVGASRSPSRTQSGQEGSVHLQWCSQAELSQDPQPKTGARNTPYVTPQQRDAASTRGKGHLLQKRCHPRRTRHKLKRSILAQDASQI